MILQSEIAYVWKTIVDPFIGKYSFIKVASGIIKSDDTLLNVERRGEERLNKLGNFWKAPKAL